MATLGAMLLSKTAITEVIDIVRAEDFYRPAHGFVYQAIAELTMAGEPADSITVAGELDNRGLLQRVGGGNYIHELTSVVVTAANASSYARRVADLARLRRMIEVGTRVVQMGYSDAASTEEVDAAVAQAAQFFQEIDQPSNTTILWNEMVADWEQWQQTDTWVLATPWHEVNKYLHGGFRKGELVFIGGRPGDGKSNLGLNITLGAAEKGKRVTVFSVEMDRKEVTSRTLAAGSWSPLGQIIGKNLDPDVRARVDEYIDSTKDMDLGLIDDAYINVEQIIAHCRARRPDAIFVDYAQLLEASNSKVSRQEQVAHITRSLKIAAKHLQMVVVVAAQLNRGPEQSKRPPVISDLRESGAAEQDADVVLLLHRPPGDDGIVKLIVGKNRNGPTGQIPLVFRGAIARIG